MEFKKCPLAEIDDGEMLKWFSDQTPPLEHIYNRYQAVELDSPTGENLSPHLAPGLMMVISILETILN
ncbi:hypothetical protein A2Z53_00810 [Candidatus Giovannonibacteria bacterium RIFCSPHIGHO2_02_42_15]|uniref:Uncharacterized protein n=2 Tax=Candidatus Giovannoniibacteriota TaxID=1752738 RepID=A0A1F5VLM7_9BACT|nr:MAG: hypothetical protein UV11_C0020G0011 [Candidatus Giovannonibacteria bacterium GW2011_GWF2_42_19]OGF64323.1 MAG: hypothetical protein A2Z53_00810 [Candidatus Giovannonibacteria bacterium RIFCSPHIGHO2_02_42_15]